MNDILKKKASIWCDRLSKLMKDKGYTQQTFLKEYKDKYKGGTQANVSRWLRVGNTIKKGASCIIKMWMLKIENTSEYNKTTDWQVSKNLIIQRGIYNEV